MKTNYVVSKSEDRQKPKVSDLEPGSSFRHQGGLYTVVHVDNSGIGGTALEAMVDRTFNPNDTIVVFSHHSRAVSWFSRSAAPVIQPVDVCVTDTPVSPQ